MQRVGDFHVVADACTGEATGRPRARAQSLCGGIVPWVFGALLACGAASACALPASAGTTGGISGIASAWDGTRVPNLLIVLINPATGVLTTTTDRRGFFVILSLPPGQYVFMNTHVGSDYFFNADCGGISVHADQVSQVHLWLEREWTGSGCNNDIESFVQVDRGA